MTEMIDDYSLDQKKINIITVTEAKKRVNRIRPLLDEITDKHHQYQHLSNDLMRVSQGNTPIDVILSVRHEVDLLEDDLLDLRDQLAEFDCVLKDWSTGLVDFIGQRENEPVWLCYKRGEDILKFYHGWDNGFRSRKLIDFD
ncbi:MAG: DUF2203 family protein [Candidatus Kariarchaeaceae archaeon]|jgi:hypothetical protein